MGHPPVMTSGPGPQRRHASRGGASTSSGTGGCRCATWSSRRARGPRWLRSDTQFRMMRAELNWDDFAWVRENWKGPLFIKGVVDADDAARAVDLGRRRGSGVATTVAASSTATWRRWMPCRRSRPGSGTGPRCCWRVGSAAAVMSSRRSAWAPRRSASDARTCTAWELRDRSGVEDVVRILREETARVMTLMGVEQPGRPGCVLAGAGRHTHCP